MPPPPAPSHEAEQPPSPPSVDGQVVLFLDDEVEQRSLIERYLRMDGRFSVLLCENTTQAFTALINTRVDCVVADFRLDWDSGYRDGVDLLDEVAASYPHIGRVCFTGNKHDLPPEVFTRHAIVEKNGQLWELADAIVQEIERRSVAAPPNP